MAQTRAEDRIRDVAPMSGAYPIFGGNAHILRSRANNATLDSAIPEGDDQLHHSFQSDTPIQGAQLPQNSFSNSSSNGLATGNPAAISAASPTLHSQQLTSFGHTPAIAVNTPASSPPIIPALAPASIPAAAQRFICDHYRIDETIVLTNAYLRKSDGIHQTEMVEKESSKSRKFGCRPKN